jgi:putative transposase
MFGNKKRTLLYQLDHCSYRCSYHIVWTPRYRGKVLADKYIKAELQRMFKQIASWKGLHIYAWHIGDEHIHLHIAIPPKYSIAYIIQILKGKTSGWIKKKTKKFPSGALWGRGYFVSTTGLDEYVVMNCTNTSRKGYYATFDEFTIQDLTLVPRFCYNIKSEFYN